jgi:hypothetical protein
LADAFPHAISCEILLHDFPIRKLFLEDRRRNSGTIAAQIAEILPFWFVNKLQEAGDRN